MTDNRANAKDAPRPWAAEQSEDGEIRVRAADGTELARLAPGGEHRMAIATLMAAAPELLAAVKAFQTFYLDVLPLLEQYMPRTASGYGHIEIPDHPAVTLSKLAVAKADRAV